MSKELSHNLETSLSPESHSRLLNLEKQILILTKGEKIDSNDSSNNESILNSLSDKDKDKLISLLETYDSVLKGETPPITEDEEDREKENDEENQEFKEYQKFEITIGGKTKEELKEELKKRNIEPSIYAQNILDREDFIVESNSEKIKLVKLSVQDLGFLREATTDEIYAKAESLGLELCPAEVGPQLRLQYEGLPGEYIFIGMKQIASGDGIPRIFYLGVSKDLFGARSTHSDLYWSPSVQFVFVMPHN
jgi:hypothetical protein